ncbi:MAG: hypothetical protein RQ885_09845 [Desulfurococcales archaeon]|jgi:hypothetical protein|nr:hypothetical protein [Desulfurococcales archaeon]
MRAFIRALPEGLWGFKPRWEPVFTGLNSWSLNPRGPEISVKEVEIS